MFFLIFYFIFNGRLSSPRSSDTNGAIFTKISGLVDRCKGLLTSLSFFDFSRDVAMATSQSQKKSAFFPDQSTLSLCHSETEWDNTLYMQNIISTTNAAITCKILVKIGPVVSAENRLTNGNCVACSRGSAYFVEYLRMYWTDFHNLFTI